MAHRHETRTCACGATFRTDVATPKGARRDRCWRCAQAGVHAAPRSDAWIRRRTAEIVAAAPEGVAWSPVGCALAEAQ